LQNDNQKLKRFRFTTKFLAEAPSQRGGDIAVALGRISGLCSGERVD